MLSTQENNTSNDRDIVKIKEYPPLISIKTIVEDQLVGAKSFATARKRLKELKITILQYDMVMTKELFKAFLPEKEKELPEVLIRRSEPFKLS